ncbi:hypothetical protein GCM10010254_22530 [Streptomyces chromofuscus]|nr:hypothetical protein GCM10010254_22530 [Streptomyces chromofuscus]
MDIPWQASEGWLPLIRRLSPPRLLSAPRSPDHQLVAAHTVLVASGLKAAAAAEGHRWFVAGFESNDTLHADNPPYWHIS